MCVCVCVMSGACVKYDDPLYFHSDHLGIQSAIGIIDVSVIGSQEETTPANASTGHRGRHVPTPINLIVVECIGNCSNSEAAS